MKRGGHKIKSIRSILVSASLVISTIAFAILVNLFAFNSDNTAMAIGKQECENSGYDTTWEGTKCYQWVTDSSVNPGLACDSKTNHQTKGGVCKKKVEVQSKADMEANNNAASSSSSSSSSSGTTDNSADPDSSADPDDTSSSSSGGDSCEESVGVFGWLLCPGQDLITNVVDYLMSLIDGSMQYTILASTDTTADTANSASIKEIWQKFANIANIIFAVAFLIMIYSMATSTGLSNYHVKKILPKIIVMAVIVNISFYICAAALDVSNILGYNIKEFIWSVSSTSADVNPLNMFTTAAGVAVTVVVALFFGGTIVVAFAIILLAIGFRHVVLTVLVIISPVALSLYMLPNTEKWAKKWTSTFISLLIVYPAFSAVWGASRLLSNTFSTLQTSSQIGTISYAIMPTICSVAPAIAIIPLFKMSSGLMGYIAGRAAGSGIAKSATTKGNSITRGAGRTIAHRPVGALAGGVSKIPFIKENGVVGTKAREVAAWANTKPNGKQERALRLAAIEKNANEQATALVSTLTQEEQLSALTRNDGRYQDRYGNVKKLGMNLNDPHIYGALMTSQASNLSTEQTGLLTKSSDFQNVASATAARIETLRNNHQYQAADALQTIATTSLSSNKNSNLSAGQINNVLSSGAHADSVYTDTVTKNASSMSKDAAASKSVDQIKEVNSIVGASKDTQAINNWKKTASDVLGDSKFTNKMSTKAQEELKNAKNL